MASYVATRSQPGSSGLNKALGWLAVVVLAALGLRFYSAAVSNYIHFDVAHYDYYWPKKWWLVGHLAGGSLALLLGPFQFSTALRRRYPKAHRVMGRMYLAGILLGAISAVYMGLWVSPDRTFGHALLFLALAWAVTSAMAFTAALRRQFAVHKEWMIRSYVVTFGFVLFRFGNDDLKLFHGLGGANAAVMNAWFCWAVPLLFTQVVLDWRRTKSSAGAVRASE